MQKALAFLTLYQKGNHQVTRWPQYTVKGITEKLANSRISTTIQKEKDEKVSQEEQTTINNLQKCESVFEGIG